VDPDLLLAQSLDNGINIQLPQYCRAGSTVHILDTADPDWWRGRCTLTGSTGYLPSTYLARVLPGEMIFRVIQPCSLLRQPAVSQSDGRLLEAE
jgi:hypothetical protein